MRSFEVPGSTLEEFVTKVRAALAGRELGELVSLECVGGDLLVSFQRMGTTRLRYAVKENGGGFVARLAEEQVAPLHAPFRQAFEEKLEQVLARVGARLV